MRGSFFSLIILLTLNNPVFCQEEIVVELPPQITESSGLIAVDSAFLSFNDSGGAAEIYVFNKLGELVHSCSILNASNNDWEAITQDDNGFIYLGDFGNNNNQRKNLRIYKLRADDVLNKLSVTADIITFSYPDQKDFPPEKPEWYYDSEALIAHGDSLFIYTKNRTKPFDGIVKVYGLSSKQGLRELKPYASINLPPTSWTENSVTDACLFENKLFLLTYRYIYILDFPTLKRIDTIEFNGLSQKEGVFYNGKTIYLTDEKTILGSAKLYKITYPL